MITIMPIKKNTNTSLGTEKTLRLLLLFTKHESLTAQEIAGELDINISSVYRIVNTMENYHFLEQNSNKSYQLKGLHILRLYNKVNTNLRAHTKPVMKQVVQKVQESVYIAELYEDDKIIIIDKEESNRHLQWRDNIGSTYPLTTGVAGKTILAHRIKGMNQASVDNFLSKLDLVPYTDSSITSISELKDSLYDILDKGYGITIEEHVSGAAGISVPIFNFDQSECKAALTVMMAVSNYNAADKMKYVNSLQEGARKIGENII